MAMGEGQAQERYNAQALGSVRLDETDFLNALYDRLMEDLAEFYGEEAGPWLRGQTWPMLMWDLQKRGHQVGALQLVEQIETYMAFQAD